MWKWRRMKVKWKWNGGKCKMQNFQRLCVFLQLIVTLLRSCELTMPQNKKAQSDRYSWYRLELYTLFLNDLDFLFHSLKNTYTVQFCKQSNVKNRRRSWNFLKVGKIMNKCFLKLGKKKFNYCSNSLEKKRKLRTESDHSEIFNFSWIKTFFLNKNKITL